MHVCTCAFVDSTYIMYGCTPTYIVAAMVMVSVRGDGDGIGGGECTW